MPGKSFNIAAHLPAMASRQPDTVALHVPAGREPSGKMACHPLTFKELESGGVAPARLRDVHSPIGLPIGAVTVNEIAVSIAAELIQVRRKLPELSRVEGPSERTTPIDGKTLKLPTT